MFFKLHLNYNDFNSPCTYPAAKSNHFQPMIEAVLGVQASFIFSEIMESDLIKRFEDEG